MCTVDASVEVVALGNLDTTFMSPLHMAVTCPLSGRFRRRVFEPSMTHSCELSRARGWRGRRQESRLPGDLPPELGACAAMSYHETHVISTKSAPPPQPLMPNAVSWRAFCTRCSHLEIGHHSPCPVSGSVRCMCRTRSAGKLDFSHLSPSTSFPRAPRILQSPDVSVAWGEREIGKHCVVRQPIHVMCQSWRLLHVKVAFRSGGRLSSAVHTGAGLTGSCPPTSSSPPLLLLHTHPPLTPPPPPPPSPPTPAPYLHLLFPSPSPPHHTTPHHGSKTRVFSA